MLGIARIWMMFCLENSVWLLCLYRAIIACEMSACYRDVCNIDFEITLDGQRADREMIAELIIDSHTHTLLDVRLWYPFLWVCVVYANSPPPFHPSRPVVGPFTRVQMLCDPRRDHNAITSTLYTNTNTLFWHTCSYLLYTVLIYYIRSIYREFCSAVRATTRATMMWCVRRENARPTDWTAHALSVSNVILVHKSRARPSADNANYTLTCVRFIHQADTIYRQ